MTAATGLINWGGNYIESNQFDDFAKRIQEHKWDLSEKLGRDVGCKVAALDLVENGDPMVIEMPDIADIQIIKAFGGRKARGFHVGNDLGIPTAQANCQQPNPTSLDGT